MLQLICQQIWKTQQWPQDWKRAVFIPIPKKGNAKESLTTTQFALISHTSEDSSVWFTLVKILQASFNGKWKVNFPDVQIGFRKGRGTKDQIASICWITEKARQFQKKSTSALLTMPEPLSVWITTNCEKFFRDGNITPPDLPLENFVCRSGSNS